MKFVNFALIKVNFFLNQEYKEDSADTVVAPDIAIRHEFREKDKQLIVILGLRQTKGNIPYRFEVEAGSLFQFDNVPEEKILKQLTTINCPAIIFPYVRETIADLTRRAGFPPLHLNPINFIQLAEKQEAKQTQSTQEISK
ncbi:MAG: protein-export chaperone SecB [Thermodesulfovibrionales bacterium]|nr:protein-export chaperone SecB [Thermodesulfovibrionales bacterium]